MAEQELARFIDRETIEYSRFYPHPIERVWHAISDPRHISIWFWTAKFEPRIGAPYRFGGDDSEMDGIIAAVDPPRLLRFAGPRAHGPEAYMQFELEPVEGGTRMIFVQHSTPGFLSRPEWPADPADHPAGDKNPWRPGTLSGWHVAFDRLAEWLNRARNPHRTPESELQNLYREHMRATQP